MVRLVAWFLGASLIGGCAWISDAERADRFDLDGDGIERPADCDDEDPAVADLRAWFTDADQDGFGAIGSEVEACQAPAGTVEAGGDCADADPTAFPGAAELCNGLDDDCDGTPDQGTASAFLYVDDDGDGYGTGAGAWICGDVEGWAEVDGDCDDADQDVNPEADEVCNGVDDDCDGDDDLDDASLDPADATWYVDLDLDGFGDDATAMVTCQPAAGDVALGGDCDDEDDAISPAVDELCNDVDDDCDAVVDEDDAADAGRWWLDADSDGFGAPLTDLNACNRPLGYVGNALDCDDAESLRKPGAVELCDGVDNDCDTLADDDDLWVADPRTWYEDVDGDGFGTSGSLAVQCAAPVGYADKGDDCRDDASDINPGALERCDAVDNDCDALVDDQDTDLDLLTAPTWYVDEDGDGFGDEDRIGAVSCVGPVGLVDDGTDCDDADPSTSPAARELCDARDNDCDDLVDEDTPTVWYFDADLDGFGDASRSLEDCNQPPGYVLDDADCDDTLAAINPDALELCDGLDGDCDGLDDDADPDSDAVTWYADGDADGFGDPYLTARGCDAPPDFVSDASDCDDGDSLVSPAGFEVCDGRDNDCDAFVDDADPEGANPPTWYLDGDLDGYGDAAEGVPACLAPYQHVADDRDCDDARPEVHPDAQEVCGGLDDDCDGLLDDADGDLDPADAAVWYADGDADGFGDPLAPTPLLCDPPAGHVADDGDCDDANPDTWPGAAELCDLQDNDCDVAIDEDTPTPWYADVDQDGFGDGIAPVIADCDPIPGRVLYAGDCDDTNAAVNPDAAERCNTVDDDCDALVDDADGDLAEPVWYYDGDGDGFGDDFEAVAACVAPIDFVADATDCDDGLVAVNPSASEICNLRDDDCDGSADDADDDVLGLGVWFTDADADGYGDVSSPVDACAQPQDAVVDASDCDDDDFKIQPAATELCDSTDNDCDALVDDADPSVVGQPTWYADLDDDGFGAGAGSLQCLQGPDQSAISGDCDDADATRWPSAPEECDGVDDDCDLAVDDNVVFRTWYADVDDDGYGDPADAVVDCVTVADRVLVGSDCDDGDAAIQPLGLEVCNGIDDDCDLVVDDGDITLDLASRTTWYTDGDLDGYGADATAAALCLQPAGTITVGGDCDDAQPLANPAGTESAGNEIDEDCSGGVLCWVDVDQDAFGADSGATVASADLRCLTSAGEALVLGDCDDAQPLVHDGLPEVPGNPLDEDCSGDRLCYVDADRDGFGADSAATVVESGDGACDVADGEGANALDCDDAAVSVNPGGTESPGNESDEDCSGDLLCYVDADGDGFGDDSAATVLSSADLLCRSVDGEALVVGDCDDAEPLANDGAVEVCNDGVDNDCDGLAPGCRREGLVALVDLTDELVREVTSDQAGASLSLPGDLTGDGVLDLVVGSPQANAASGSAWIVAGPLGGTELLANAIELTGVGTEQSGFSVGSAGDRDGDGDVELLVGAPFSNAGTTNRGAVFLHEGPVSSGPLDPADLELYGVASAERFGESLAGPADLDGDAVPDFVIGAPNADTVTGNSGSVYVMSGATAATGTADLTAAAVWYGGTGGEASGTCVATGDLDGDGLDDVLSGAPGVSLPLIAQGFVDVILDIGSGEQSLGASDAHYSGVAALDRAGESCAVAGDVNGDGFGDVLVGAPDAASAAGRAYLMLGPPVGTVSLAEADATFLGATGSAAGAAVHGPGDVDGDGFDDVVIGAPDDDTNGSAAGAVHLLYGDVVGAVDLATGADLTALGPSADQRAGASLTSGDIDGDGKSDVVIGATGLGGQSEAGWILFGEGL